MFFSVFGFLNGFFGSCAAEKAAFVGFLWGFCRVFVGFLCLNEKEEEGWREREGPVYFLVKVFGQR